MHKRSRRSRPFLSSAPLPCVPLTEIIGNNRVLIENHKGIVQYGCDEISIKISSGMICVGGNALELNCISRDKVVISGQIACIRFD